MEDDEDGLTLTFCSTRPEFRALSEDEVLAAVENDDNGGNPIVAEITRLGAEFLARLRAYTDERGGVGARALLVDARCPIEKFAIETVMRFVTARNGGAGLH